MLMKKMRRHKRTIKKLVEEVKRPILKERRLKRIEKLVEEGLPGEMKPALEYLVTRKPDKKSLKIIKRAEKRREEKK